MTVEFFGPWVIRVEDVVDVFEPRLTLAGTDNADGEYFPVSGQPLDVAVTGSAWTINAHTPWSGDDGATVWDPLKLRRSTRFDRMTGLIVDLETGRPSGGGIGPVYFFMRLVCVCADPEVNPDPLPNPYDFTLPDGT